MAVNIDPAVYSPLLDTIAKGESRGNYNAHFGNANNTAIRFTDMSVGEVLKWQEDFIGQGNPSSAVGKYQIVNTTLKGLVNQLGISQEAKFDEKLQDQMAVALLERRGATEYMTDQLTREEFAANLAREWAALPKITHPNPERSYYAGDGLNKEQVTIDEILKALATIKR
jgi:conjugal transfer mating pair stabilization protein TraG